MQRLIFPLALMLVSACVNSFKGENPTKSFDDAVVIVSAYQTEELAESEFLEDWPDLQHRAGDKEGWLWGILETLKSGSHQQDSRSYLVGYFDSEFVTTHLPTSPGISKSDSLSQGSDYKTVTSQKWSRHEVWRFDFQDSLLVGIELVGAP